MKQEVIRLTLADHEVRMAVIGTIAVVVVDDHPFWQWPSKSLFGD